MLYCNTESDEESTRNGHLPVNNIKLRYNSVGKHSMYNTEVLSDSFGTVYSSK